MYFGYKWDEIMEVPLKLFWAFLGNMYRLQAAENLRWVQVLSIPHASEDDRKHYSQGQIKRMGVVQVSEERDSEGVNKLKNLM